MKRWRIREVWKVEGWAYVWAESKELAEKLFGDGEGEFDAPPVQDWEFYDAKGSVEEAP